MYRYSFLPTPAASGRRTRRRSPPLPSGRGAAKHRWWSISRPVRADEANTSPCAPRAHPVHGDESPNRRVRSRALTESSPGRSRPPSPPWPRTEMKRPPAKAVPEHGIEWTAAAASAVSTEAARRGGPASEVDPVAEEADGGGGNACRRTAEALLGSNTGSPEASPGRGSAPPPATPPREASLVKESDAAAQRSLVEVGGGDEDRNALPRRRGGSARNRAGRRGPRRWWARPAGGLRGVHEGAREPQFLLHPAGQVAREAAPEGPQAAEGEQPSMRAARSRRGTPYRSA